MGSSAAGQSKTLAVVIATLFLTCLLPLVSASGGGAVVDVSTFSLSDFEAIESDSYELEFDLVEVLSSSAEVEVRVLLSSLDGTQYDAMSQNLTVVADSTLPVAFTLSPLPYGYTTVEVELLGDLGAPNSTQAVSVSRTLHRLKPADISLATAGQVLLSGLTANGELTGNVSLHDGDFLQTEVAVINDGDFSWTGTLFHSLLVNMSHDNQSASPITVDAQSSLIVVFNSTIALIEGTTTMTLQLNASGDGDSSDEFREIVFEVAPPPLPILTLSFSEDNGDLTSGDAVEWNLSVSNSGPLDYQGGLLCTFGQETLYDSLFTLLAMSTNNVTLTSTARPDILTCALDGPRISDASVPTISLFFDIESAAFESAGSGIPSLLQGPWHEGDTVVFSMLVRNSGEKTGQVFLVCESLGVEYDSDVLVLDVDSAGEVRVSLPVTAVGDQAVNWSLISIDGSVAEGLNGSLMVPVAAQQTLTPLISSVTWDAEIGVQFNWSVELSEGIDRDVRIRLGSTSSGLDVYPVDYEANLEPGVTSGVYTVGFVDSDRVSLRVTPLNWTTGFGFSSVSRSVPDDRPVYTVDFNPLSTPNRPIPGETGSVTVQVRNSGDVDGTDGYLILSTQDGLFLGETDTESLDANADSSYSFSFVWPDMDLASLRVTWVVGEQSFTASNSFQSGSVVVEEASFEFPWVGLIGGVMLAVAVGAFIRIYQNRSTGLSKAATVRVHKLEDDSTPKSTVSRADKIQVGCPECARQLRVPSDYGGQVRCPDCSHRFEVTPRIDPTREEAEPELEHEGEADSESDGKVEIHCPECAQSLRIPGDYQGSVRCPACEEVFSAVQD